MHVLKHLACTIGLLIMGLLVGCQLEQPYTEEGKATLRLQLNVPALSIEQRSVSSHPTDPNTWTSWERAVDGRYLYRVTAILLQGNRMLECKDLSLTGEPTEATLEFEGNYSHGSYRLMVVANYSAHQANDGVNGTKSYAGLTDFTNVMNSVIPLTNVDDFISQYANRLINYQISSHNGICERVPQPLSLVKEIELHPGVNEVSGELLRTYSRMRIVVENHSEEVLEVSSLKFSNLFTQKKAFLFAPYGYVNDRTTLKVNSEYALTPFIATTSAPLEIEAGGNAVVFDAYILESQKGANEEDYQYTLGLNYEGMNSSYTLKSNTAINNISDIDTGYYLIYNTYRKRYLIQNNGKVERGEMSQLTFGMTLDSKYVWTLEKINNNNYYIGTSEGLNDDQTAYYWNKLENNGITLGPLKSVAYSLNNQENSYISISSNGKYVYVGSSSINSRDKTSTSTRFYFYPVEAPAASEAVVPLKTIDEQTGQAVLVDEIKRNDFINAVVTVSYSKNKGHFTFEVKNWQTGGGDVSFN